MLGVYNKATSKVIRSRDLGLKPYPKDWPIYFFVCIGSGNGIIFRSDIQLTFMKKWQFQKVSMILFLNNQGITTTGNKSYIFRREK